MGAPWLLLWGLISASTDAGPARQGGSGITLAALSGAPLYFRPYEKEVVEDKDMLFKIELLPLFHVKIYI
jgi:hypothetical protein